MRTTTPLLVVKFTGCGFAAIAKPMKRFIKLFVFEQVPQEKMLLITVSHAVAPNYTDIPNIV